MHVFWKNHQWLKKKKKNPPEALVIKNPIIFKAALCSCFMMETGWSWKWEINPHLSNNVSFANTSAFESRTEISTAYNGFRWINSPPHCIPYKPVCICRAGCIQGAGSTPTHWFIKRGWIPYLNSECGNFLSGLQRLFLDGTLRIHRISAIKSPVTAEGSGINTRLRSRWGESEFKAHAEEHCALTQC